MLADVWKIWLRKVSNSQGEGIYHLPEDVTSIEPNSNQELQQIILNEMAEWFYTEVVQVKTGTYMKSEESGKLEEKIVMRG